MHYTRFLCFYFTAIVPRVEIFVITACTLHLMRDYTTSDSTSTLDLLIVLNALLYFRNLSEDAQHTAVFCLIDFCLLLG